MINMSAFSDWQSGIVNRNYFIYQYLRQRPWVDNVIAADFFPVKLKPAIGYYPQNLLLGLKNKNIIFGDLTSVCYQHSDKTYVYSSIDGVWSKKIIVAEIKKIIDKLGLKNDLLVWSYNPMFTEFIDELNFKMFIFDSVDNWLEHSAYLKLISRQKLKNNYKKIADRADLIFTVSRELIDFYQSLKRKSNIFWIPNGVDFDYYNDEKNLRQKTELDNEQRKIIGYLGTIQDRVNIDLIKYIAEKNSDMLVALCGPVWKSVRREIHLKLKPLPNVKLFGRIPYQSAPAYINRFSVGIIPHRLDKFIASTNPMKLYDYLALGKPVVSTAGAGVDVFKDIIHIAKSPAEFNKLIQKSFHDDPNLAKKRITAARENDWQSRIDMMEKIIFNDYQS